jgi:DNA-binding transcriptional LysR family regulator
MRFTLKHLEYFVAAGETGSIKHAAEGISISQSSISVAIAHLELEFGVQLFVRQHAQGLTLTSAGRRMMREAKLLLRQADGLYSVAGELSEQIRGPLSVGCMVTLAPMILPELGHGFMEAHPDVRLSIREGDHEKLLLDLRQVEIDAAISYDLQVPEEVVFEPLVTLPPQVLLPTGHELAGRASVSLGDLEDEPLILLDLPYSRQYFLSLFQREGITPNIYGGSANQEVVRTMVANGYGFTITNVRPRNLTTLDGRDLAVVGLAGDHHGMTVGVAMLRQDLRPKVLQAFMQHCRQAINDNHIPGMVPLVRSTD